MTIKEKYKEIAIKNKSLLKKVIDYACAQLKITINEFESNLRHCIKLLLNDIRTNNNKVSQIRLRRDNLRDDLTDLERAFCNSGNSEFVEVGKNTGGKKNNVELKQIEKIKVKEELGKLVIETLILEKSLTKNNELIKKFLNLVPRRQYLSVLELTYIDCLSNTKIALELNYTRDFVDQARKRGISDLVDIVASWFEQYKNKL